MSSKACEPRSRQQEHGSEPGLGAFWEGLHTKTPPNLQTPSKRLLLPRMQLKELLQVGQDLEVEGKAVLRKASALTVAVSQLETIASLPRYAI